MSDSFAKIQMLMSQGRTELAMREIHQLLTENPQNGPLHSLLAMCLSDDDEKLDQATDAAKQAVTLAPDEPFSHYVLSLVWDRRGQNQWAIDSIQEAIRLDPEDADYFAALSRFWLIGNQFQRAFDTANEGLVIDAEHIDCGNYRSIALERLGKTADAVTASRENLQRDPNNANSHVTHGYALLHSGQYKDAQIAFREALRLDPSDEIARLGMMDALNSTSFIFRAVYAYYGWISRLGTRAGFLLIVGAWLLVQILNRASQAIPALRPWVFPLLAVYISFAVMSWIAKPLFNTFLRFHPLGKHLLRPLEFWASTLIAVVLALGCFGMGIGIWIGDWGLGLFFGGYWVSLSIPIAATFSMNTPKRRLVFGAATIGVGLIPVLLLARAVGQENSDLLFGSLKLFVMGMLAIQITSQIVINQPVTR